MAGALTTVQLQAVARGAMTPLPLEELQQLAAVFGMVKSDYVEPVDDKKLITDAISGMVASLDPHSVYFDKKSFKEFREGTTGRFVGVGIEISQEDGLVKVVSPIEGSPADRAGLKPNDLITKIDDTFVKGLTLNEAVKKMRGEPRTKVLLTIFRKDENRTFPVSITREEIRTQSVRSKVLEPGYAWIRLSQFQERTVEDFVTKLEQIYKQEPKLKGLVLDLRNDPGGLLDAAEFNNASSDRVLGFPDVSKICMLLSYHQNAEQFEIMFNKAKYDALPVRMRAIIESAVEAASADMSWKAIDRYSKDYIEMQTNDKVRFFKTPDAILKQQLEIYDRVVEAKSKENPMFREIVQSQLAFSRRATQWEQDTVVNRRMAFDHYWGPNGVGRKI
jgi:hypothetical protein